MKAMSKNQKTEFSVDRVYEKIQNKIIYGVWNEEHYTHEQKISEELGANRTHVRQALSRLQRDGLIKIIPRYGVQIVPMSLQSMREIYQISTRIELLAVETVASKNLTSKELMPLEKVNREMATAYESSDLKAFFRANEAFHHGLVTLSENQILCDVYKNIYGRTQWARLIMLTLAPPTVASSQEHANVLEAICDGKIATAREKIEQHFEKELFHVNSLTKFPPHSPF